MKKEIITSVDPKSPVSEVFRALRTNLQYLNKNDGAQTILLTSTMQGEGKSFVAANLAVTFAQAGKDVLIIDTDMRRPRQNKIFDADLYPGLSNYLSGVNIYRSSHEVKLKECIYKTKIDNLSLLPAGNIPPNPSELLQSEKLPELIKELKGMFDVLIFDGAPCLLVTDATLVSRLVDATILVCSQRKTRIEELKEAKTRIKRVGGNIAGVVLNRVKVSSKKYGEKYYYASTEKDNKSRKHQASKRKKDYFAYEEDVDDDVEYIEPKEETRKRTTTKRKKAESTDSSNSDKIKEILAEINKIKEDNK